jgi:hypothetical protein
MGKAIGRMDYIVTYKAHDIRTKQKRVFKDVVYASSKKEAIDEIKDRHSEVISPKAKLADYERSKGASSDRRRTG